MSKASNAVFNAAMDAKQQAAVTGKPLNVFYASQSLNETDEVLSQTFSGWSKQGVTVEWSKKVVDGETLRMGTLTGVENLPPDQQKVIGSKLREQQAYTLQEGLERDIKEAVEKKDTPAAREAMAKYQAVDTFYNHLAHDKKNHKVLDTPPETDTQCIEKLTEINRITTSKLSTDEIGNAVNSFSGGKTGVYLANVRDSIENSLQSTITKDTANGKANVDVEAFTAKATQFKDEVAPDILKKPEAFEAIAKANADWKINKEAFKPKVQEAPPTLGSTIKKFFRDIGEKLGIVKPEVSEPTGAAHLNSATGEKRDMKALEVQGKELQPLREELREAEKNVFRSKALDECFGPNGKDTESFQEARDTLRNKLTNKTGLKDTDKAEKPATLSVKENGSRERS